MPKWRKKTKVVDMAAASYFFPEIAYKCCEVQRTCKEERVRADPCLLSVEIAIVSPNSQVSLQGLLKYYNEPNKMSVLLLSQ